MNKVDREKLREKLANRTLIQQALRRAAQEAVLMHARAGNPIATWREGQVEWIQPEHVLSEFDNQPKK